MCLVLCLSCITRCTYVHLLLYLYRLLPPYNHYYSMFILMFYYFHTYNSYHTILYRIMNIIILILNPHFHHRIILIIVISIPPRNPHSPVCHPRAMSSVSTDPSLDRQGLDRPAPVHVPPVCQERRNYIRVHTHAASRDSKVQTCQPTIHNDSHPPNQIRASSHARTHARESGEVFPCPLSAASHEAVLDDSSRLDGVGGLGLWA